VRPARTPEPPTPAPHSACPLHLPLGIMEPATVKCDKCGTRALVHDVHFEYMHADLNGLPAAKHEVKAVIRDIECPECGRRKQYQTFNNMS
jgi:DNA-directed RNA polymerase subunit RPC12/RpoP